MAVALAQLYVRVGRFEEAIRILTPLAQRLPDLTLIRYVLGHAALGAGRADQAIAQFQEVVRQAPENPVARYSLGTAYVRGGRPQEGLKELLPLAKTMGKIADYHMGLGRAYLLLARWDDAVSAARTAARLAPQSPLPYGLLGAIYARRGDFTKAGEMYTRALEIHPDFTAAHLARGAVSPGSSTPAGGTTGTAGLRGARGALLSGSDPVTTPPYREAPTPHSRAS